MSKVLFILLFLLSSTAASARVVFAISNSAPAPMAIHAHGHLAGGVVHDLGLALARAMRSEPVFVLLPRRRLEEHMNRGAADVVCDQNPAWIEHKDWLWSAPLIDDEGMIVSRYGTPMVSSLQELSGVSIGTLLGYRYPDLDAATGGRFGRDNALTDSQNLKKLMAGRFPYIEITKMALEYQIKLHPGRFRINTATLRIGAFQTYCALSPSSGIDARLFLEAVAEIKRNGTVAAILRRYMK